MTTHEAMIEKKEKIMNAAPKNIKTNGSFKALMEVMSRKPPSEADAMYILGLAHAFEVAFKIY